MSEKKCPVCMIELHDVLAESHHGTNVRLYQCKKCGGLWFDALDLFRVNPKEGDRIDKKTFSQMTVANNAEMYCPNDRSPLVSFRDQNYPPSFIFEHCRTCDGYWMNRGKFKEFSAHRIKKITESNEKKYTETDQEFYRIMNNLLHLRSDTDYIRKLGRFGEFLSTPIDRSSLKAIGENEDHNKRIDAITGVIRNLFARY